MRVLKRASTQERGFTLRVQRSTSGSRFAVTTDGRGASGRAGLALLAEVADRLGLTAALSRATGASRSWSRHDPGVVLRDVLLMLVDGGDALRHMSVLAGQPALFGAPASAATTCRTLKAVAADADAMAGLATARKDTRARVWALGGTPPEVTAARARERGEEPSEPDEPLVIDLDATICIAHSEDKDGAAATYKHTWGFHPLLAYLDRGDGRGEALAGRLRPGNAGSNHAGDHIAVFDDARAQLPALPERLERLVRCDAAGATHDLLAHVVAQGWRFSVSFPLYEAVRAAIRALPEERWTAATDRQGEPRTNAAVAELTADVDLAGWPAGARLLVRREPLHPGAQQTFDDVDGYRFTCLLTNQPGEELARLEQRHRARAHVEDWIRAAKDMGLRTLPLDSFARNALWLQLVLAAQDLMWCTQVLTLTADELRLAEPQQLRYKLLHLPARLTRHARRWNLRLQHNWPWAAALRDAFQRLRALPAG